jgi:oligopeptide/dipeptide ABC transporter ATP-binding protein
MKTPLLELDNVTVAYKGRGGIPVQAVRGVSLSVMPEETLGLVGESGCGKSTLVRAVMGLVEKSGGRIRFDGRDLGDLSAGELRKTRLDLQMVFQDPFASLDPAMTVGEIVSEALTRRERLSGSSRRRAVAAILEHVGLPADAMSRFPHEFSGGQRQRIAIARALAVRPRLLIADEAVSALDVSVQSQILNLLLSLKKADALAMVFVSHDLSVVRHMSDKIAVMYLGNVVEYGPAKEVLESPLHLYTKALLSASPVADPVEQKKRVRMLLRGEPPSPTHPPTGCAFAWRSPKAVPDEIASHPGNFREVAQGHWVEIHPATVDDSEALLRQADALGQKTPR